MATPSTKPATRETTAFVREKGVRAVIATLVGGVLVLRPKGLRTAETLDLGWCWQQAVKQRVAAERAQRWASKAAGTRKRADKRGTEAVASVRRAA